MFKIDKATKRAARLRAALIGPSGSGKTYSALAIAAGLGSRVVVIDTERGSASKYADTFRFDVGELDTFAPATYVEAIRACEEAGADVIVIDSLSHAWMGAGGALEMVDKAAARSQSRNSFDAWRSVTPQHNALVDAMLRCKAHLIVTMRSKTEYVLEEDARGRKVPRKVGMAPVQRDGLEYEFDVVMELNADHQGVVTKSRCSALADAVFDRPGAGVARVLRAWLTDGTPAEIVEAPPVDHGVEPAPEVSPFERAEVMLRNARSLPILAAAWKVLQRDALPKLGPGERATLTALKDERKAALTVRAEAEAAMADADAERAAIVAEGKGGEVAGE